MDTRQKAAFDDFCGPHYQEILTDINSLDKVDAEKFFLFLEFNPNFTTLTRFFGDDLDKLAHFAMLAFYENKLTRQQVATILEYRSMLLDFKKVRVVNIFSPAGEMTQEFLSILSQFANDDEQDSFEKLLRERKNYDCCYFQIDIDTSLLSDPRAIGTLQLANYLGVIHYVPSIIQRVDTPDDETNESTNPTIYHAHYLGTAMRDAMTQAIFGDQAKQLYPRLGIFNIDDIERSVRKFGRYSAIDYPGIACAKEFHGIKAPALLNTLHDELHRRLISTIPNPVFSAYLHLIDVIRKKSNLAPAKGKNGKPLSDGIFSTEIWEAIDMECGLFINKKTNILTINSVTMDFIEMMSTRVYSENSPVGLCPASSYIDTTWLALIDMSLNAQEWLTYSIDTSLLASHKLFGSLYTFIEDHQDLLRQQNSPAKQVALIKSLWFDLPYDETKETRFRRKDNHVELLHDKHLISPTQCSKKMALTFLDLQLDFFSSQETIISYPDLFLEFISRIAKDKHEFDRLIITRERFDFFIKFVNYSNLTALWNKAINAKIDSHINAAKAYLEESNTPHAIDEFMRARALTKDEQAIEKLDKSIKKARNKWLLASILTNEENTFKKDKLDIKSFDFTDLANEWKYKNSTYSAEIQYDFTDEKHIINDAWDTLHNAVDIGNIDRIDALLKEGADPTARDDDGYTPILLTVKNKNIEAFNLLFNHMMNTGCFQDKSNLAPVLIEALETNQLDLAVFLVDKGADVNTKTTHGWTALHIAAVSGLPDIIMTLLCKNANTSIQNNAGDTAILLALQNNQLDAFKLLFNHMSTNGDFNQEGALQQLCSKVSASGKWSFNEELMYLIALMPGNTLEREQTKSDPETLPIRFFQTPPNSSADTHKTDSPQQSTTPNNPNNKS